LPGEPGLGVDAQDLQQGVRIVSEHGLGDDVVAQEIFDRVVMTRSPSR
jgi:hypothetical protein